MAGGAGAGVDGGAGGGDGGGDGRGPSGGSSSSGGRSLQRECPSVSEAVSRGCALRGAGRPGEEAPVPGLQGGCGGAGPPRGRRVAGGEGTVVWLRLRRRQRRTGWFPCARAVCAAVLGAVARGVALGAGRAFLGGSGAGPADSGPRGAGPVAPRTPGNRPRASARVYRAAGLHPPRAGRESGQPGLERDQACRWLLPRGEVRLSR